MLKPVEEIHQRALSLIVGEGDIVTDTEELLAYGHDHTEDLSYPPDLVLKPRSTQEVSKIMRYCNANRIPVTPIGALTGLSGGALSVHGGVGLSLERMNSIVKIDTENHQVIVQPGVITEVIQKEVEKHNLFYAPDPASKGSCFIGGNLAENSGGPRAVKYGVTKDWVLDLEVVLPSGEIIQTGAKTLKNSTGYNLTQLMIGSEGTLGIITEATLKLLPLPKQNVLMLAPFSNASDACKAVAGIFQAGVVPSALEFMELDALDLAQKFTGDYSIPLDPSTQAHLLIEVDGNDLDYMMGQSEQILKVLELFHCGEVRFADDHAQKEALWFLRRRVGEAVKAHSVYKEEDTVVPRFELPNLLKGVKQIGAKFGFQTVCYGHAGDGNLHVNILKGDLSDEIWNGELQEAITEIFKLCISLGGTLSGEHGIGLVQKEFMPLAFSSVELGLMKGIKETFDPIGILNPGKIFPTHMS